MLTVQPCSLNTKGLSVCRFSITLRITMNSQQVNYALNQLMAAGRVADAREE